MITGGKRPPFLTDLPTFVGRSMDLTKMKKIPIKLNSSSMAHNGDSNDDDRSKWPLEQRLLQDRSQLLRQRYFPLVELADDCFGMSRPHNGCTASCLSSGPVLCMSSARYWRIPARSGTQTIQRP